MPRPAPSAWRDISVPVRTGMPVWPGDPPTLTERLLDLHRGDPCTLTRVAMCAHAGTHLDSPAHYLPGGADMDALPLDAGIGRARIIAIRDQSAVTVEELAERRIRRGERILLKTANSPRVWTSGGFVEDFVRLTPGAAAYLAKRGPRLLGVDGLSVGGPDQSGGEVHRILLEAGIWILEGLDLSDVEPGPVDLLCLPLRLAGAEGAPARALVRPVRGPARGPVRRS
ncbi:cyclase family protein [Fundidesulfovibrio agrisoli]|uniref:cyclase family protein n=1 Tax=Fundidesulfovibrio agrisoli TaxID=2922717 RepID=UPI001FADB9D7|nr:cyclase family protein [Fundidesulfovibrio agrisoli]